MLPKFPLFKKLELKDKEDIEKYTKHFPPYSDFSFSSLWSWNTKNHTELSLLNENLVIGMKDYSNDSLFYSFLGFHSLIHTIDTLLKDAQERRIEQALKLIPEHNFIHSDLEELHRKYSIKEDRDNFDYILSVEKLSIMQGPKLYQKKKQLNKFLRLYNYNVTIDQISNKSLHSDLLNFFHTWKSLKQKGSHVNLEELRAIERFIDLFTNCEIIVASVYIDNVLKGYSLFEQINSEYSLYSFQKTDTSIIGINEFLNNCVAKYLNSKKSKYLNIEQDLGIEGLRKAKKAYDPTFLKKYTITPKT